MGKIVAEKERTKFGVHVLVVLFGITSWSIMNGLWVELPILVADLPEGWTLPSYLTIISQCGNLGPILFSLLVYLVPHRKFETPTSLLVNLALTLCAALYAFFWNRTAVVAGGDHSVTLLSLTLCQAIFAATTSMCYLAFMAHLKAYYMGSIFIGMSLSGLIPALAAVGQGSGDVRCVDNYSTTARPIDIAEAFADTTLADVLNGTGYGPVEHNTTTLSSLLAVNEEPAFTVQAFFLMLAGMGLVSLLAFGLLVYHPYCLTEHVDTDKEENCQLMKSKTAKHNKSKHESLSSTTFVDVLVENQISKNSSIGTYNYTDSTTESEKYLVHGSNADGNIQRNNSSFRNNQNKSLKNGIVECSFKSEHLNMYELSSKSMTEDSSMSASLNTEQTKHTAKQTGGVGDSDETCVCVTSLSLGPATSVHVEPSTSGSAEPTRSNSSEPTTTRDNTEPTTRDTLEPSRSPSVEPAEDDSDQNGKLSMHESWYLLALLAWINVLQTSFALAIQVYSSLPYGLLFYNGATKAENIVDPIACFLTMWIRVKSLRVISCLTLLGTLFTGYIITVASMSPNPFLVHETIGGILVIAAWVMSTIFNVFTKVSIASVMRSQGRTSLIWTGGSTQVGALIGAILAYVLINELHIFKDSPWC
ncbi:solute carrier family 52, riboflavin transporter, member 3-B-like [Physella acuta]|uniref:solute carrier family 52, riboflavin transporter, member 3-B-like n=1 Tax=Physella acuta TaxID=109671 RepID=UPI0027DD74BF|nr:solute carrier family 52, riboflavin transporter, member 3-B-like [Physella acuta]